MRRGMLIGAVAAASIALTGCAGQALGAPTPTGSASPSPAGVSGTGPTGFPGVDFPLEAGARSVAVEFECSSGPYTVELSDSMMLGQAPYSGECASSPVTVTWPITERTTETMSVTVRTSVDTLTVVSRAGKPRLLDATAGVETADGRIWSLPEERGIAGVGTSCRGESRGAGCDQLSCRSVLISGLGLNLRGLCPHGVHRRERRPRIGHVVVWSLSGRHPGLAKLLGFVNIAMVLAAFVLVLAVVVLVTPCVDPRRSES